MKNVALFSSILFVSLSFGGVAHACDMHGGGYGGYGSYGNYGDYSSSGDYGVPNLPWEASNPMSSTTSPDLDPENGVKPVEKETSNIAKPSFSNAANLAAEQARARLAKKDDAETPDETAIVKEVALNADR